jgi:hypothetical protein
MPAVSKKQQQLFGIVHAYQTGKLSGNKVSAQIKKIAKSISPEEAKKYATTSHKSLKEILEHILQSPAYTLLTLQEITTTATPQKVKGVVVDAFTSHMLLTVANRLSEHNKQKFLQYPLNEMVASAYKVITL